MRSHIRWIMLIAGLFLAPSVLFAQGSYTYEVPPAIFTGPLSHPRYEDGGIYVGLEFLYWKTNRQLAAQNVAYRGFLALDNSIPGVNTGDFVGTHNPALNTNEVAGTGVFQPGWDLFIGWRFQGGVAVEMSWRHLTPANYQASASIIPPNYKAGSLLENTFLFAPVTNASTDWSGNDVNVQGGAAGSTFGIWNAASFMKITLTQAIDVYQINVRIPMWDTDNYRSYGLIGPRIVTLQDKFAWLTIDADVNGNFTDDTQATYTNTVTNNMYGVHFGFGHEWYLGTTPAGAFAVSLEGEAAVYANLVKASSNWDRGDGLVSLGRVRNMSSIVPGVEARIGLWWYPWEAIQVHLGYDVMTFFNTIASRHPIDFNMGSNNPQFDNVLFRWTYGLNFGVTFVF
jgi:hypothetical protein